MYFKIRDPKKEGTLAELITACVFAAGFTLLAWVCLGIPSDKIKAWLNGIFSFIFGTGILLGILLITVLLTILALIIRGVWKYIKKRQELKQSSVVRGIDFQENHLVLISKTPTVLTYPDTSLQLDIYVDFVPCNNIFDRWYEPGISMLAFDFATSAFGERHFLCTTHNGPIEELFETLPYIQRFRKFTYRIHVATLSRYTARHPFRYIGKYRDFVKEQIQNQKRYGVHYPCTRQTMWFSFGILIAGLAVLIACLWMCLKLVSTAGSYLFLLPIPLLLFAFGKRMWVSGIQRILKYFKASKVLKQAKQQN